MKYKPKTKFYMTDDCGMVYSLKQDGWCKGRQRMVNDVCISINADAEFKPEIASLIMNAMNQTYKMDKK